jgi:hypothetical protein
VGLEVRVDAQWSGSSTSFGSGGHVDIINGSVALWLAKSRFFLVGLCGFLELLEPVEER